MAEYISPDEASKVTSWVAICGTLAPMSSIIMFLSVSLQHTGVFRAAVEISFVSEWMLGCTLVCHLLGYI